MKFIKDIISRKSKDSNESVAPMKGYSAEQGAINTLGTALDSGSDLGMAQPNYKTVKVVDKPTEPVVNIWDMEADQESEAAELQDTSPKRRRRNATRVLSFDGDAAGIVPMFENALETKPAERTKFPVGWLLVAQGPGRGECFTLEPGMSQIGRGADQAIQLDFGDNSISRSNHAAIVYDTETHAFMIGHGGKKNIVRLNGNPVISNETLNAGDMIKIGETELYFVPLCTHEFNWSDASNQEEDEDVAIA